MASESDIVTHFLPLDELIQVIYQGSSRFVVISSVDDHSWTVHLGLSGEEGRWWRGSWADNDVRDTIAYPSDRLETYADQLSEAFVHGEMYVGNWRSQEGARINFVLGTNLESPAHIPLLELSAQEAASFAVKVFTNIAIQAQSRKSRLHPLPFQPSTVDPSVHTKALGALTRSVQSLTFDLNSTDSGPAAKVSTASSSEHATSSAVKPLGPQPGDDRSRTIDDDTSSTDRKRRKVDKDTMIHHSSGTTSKSQSKVFSDSTKLQSIAKPSNTSTGVACRGISLANPTRKARKYETLEFGSDDD